MSKILEIPRSSYYKNKNRTIPKKEKQDQLICNLIIEYDNTYHHILGYRRMTMYINKLNNLNICERYVLRLMGILGIHSAIRKKRYKYTRKKPAQVGKNILARDFTANNPNEKWLTDVTEFKIPGKTKKLFLSPILDLYDKSIITYNLSFTNNNTLVFKMFNEAIKMYPDAKPIFHSDRGYQYTSKEFKRKLDEANMTQSMSRVGKCIDNGPMEGFFGIIKSEMFYLKKFKTFEELKEAIKKYIYFYNQERLQARLNCKAPMIYRNQALHEIPI